MPDPVDPNAAAPAAPAVDHAAELEKERARAAAAEQQAAAIRQQAEVERAQYAAWAQSLQASLAASQQPQAQAQPDDPNVVVTRGDVDAMMKQAQANWMNQVGQVMGQQELQRLNATRATNRRLAASDPSMPYFGRFATEIDTILNSVDPRVSSQENAYRQTYEIVRARHFDELMNEERQRWRSQATDDGDFEPEGGLPQPGTTAQPQAQPPPVNPRAPVMPTPTGGTPVRGAQRRARREALDAYEQDAINRHFGGDVNAYEQALKAEAEEDPYDMFGFMGKKRV